MKFVQKAFETGYALIIALFFLSALTMIVFSAGELWGAIRPAEEVTMQVRFIAVLECIGLLTIAVAALELGQTLLEEELQRSSTISAPTRVRRFLSRFVVVVVVALAIECLVAVFQFIHDAPELLPHAATIGLAAAALLAAWGVFVRFNIAAEHLEPDAKQEDDKVHASNNTAEEAAIPERGATDDEQPGRRGAGGSAEGDAGRGGSRGAL